MVPLEELTFPQLLMRTAKRCGQRPAVWYRSETMTYNRLARQVEAYGAALCAGGIRKGDHVAIWADNSPETLISFYAVMSVGAVAVMLNTSLTQHEITELLAFSDSKALILGALRNTEPDCVRLHSLIQQLPFLQNVYTIPGAACQAFPSLTEAAERVTPEDKAQFCLSARAVRPADTAAMLFTSGSSGKCKGVLTSHYSRVNSGIQQAADLGACEEDRFCAVLPMFHCFAVSANLLACLSAGGCLCIPESSRSRAVAETIREAGCTIFNAVPTLYFALMRRSEYTSDMFVTLRTGIIGGAGYSSEDFVRINNHFHMTLLSSLGQTETTAGSTVSRPDDTLEVRSTTLGRFMSHVEGKIVDLKTGQTLPDGEIGEICIRGYLVMQGYYRQNALTAETIDADGWLHTGDLGSLDENGLLTLHGRCKELIIRGGENISPVEIEQAVCTLPQVAGCKVIGVPDSHFGEEICACVVLREGAGLSAEELRRGLKDRLAHYKIPAYILFWDSLPMNATGKIDLTAVRERAGRELGRKGD